jgi:hypothetical protein
MVSLKIFYFALSSFMPRGSVLTCTVLTFRSSTRLRLDVPAGHVVHHPPTQDQEADPGRGRPLLTRLQDGRP